MAKLTVLSWYWRQEGCRSTFTAHNVNCWAAMVRRHCTLDIELACVTDMPDGIDPSIRIIKPPGEWEGLQTAGWKGGRPSCYRRISMFRPDAARIFGRRFCAMDLDVVIGGNIDPILDRDDELILCAPSNKGARWLYNGSMLMMTAGCRPQVYETFTPERAELASRKFVGSDQAWLAYALGPGEKTWGPADGVVRFGQAATGPMMFFPGHTKPWDCLHDSWIGANYRMAEGRSGIILGQKPHVWEEAAKAQGPFDHVIALPAAAREWPNPVDAVAETIEQAKVLAKMLGIDRPVICGA
jgi:hypothetical protein